MGDDTGGVTIGDCGTPRVTLVFASDGNSRDEALGGVFVPTPVGAGVGGISSEITVSLVAACGSTGDGSPTVSDSLGLQRKMPLGTLQLSILSVLMIAWTTS